MIVNIFIPSCKLKEIRKELYAEEFKIQKVILKIKKNIVDNRIMHFSFILCVELKIWEVEAIMDI